MSQRYSGMFDTLRPDSRSVHCEVHGFTKTGKVTHRCVAVWHSKYSPLYQCEACGKLGTNHYGRKNAVFPAWEHKDPANSRKRYSSAHPRWSFLCRGCRNTVEANARRWEKADDARLEINRIKRELNEIAKNNV